MYGRRGGKRWCEGRCFPFECTPRSHPLCVILPQDGRPHALSSSVDQQTKATKTGHARPSPLDSGRLKSPVVPPRSGVSQGKTVSSATKRQSCCFLLLHDNVTAWPRIRPLRSSSARSCVGLLFGASWRFRAPRQLTRFACM